VIILQRQSTIMAQETGNLYTFRTGADLTEGRIEASARISLASTGDGNDNEGEATLDAIFGVRCGKTRRGIRDGDGFVGGIGDWVRL
jgi:hypothetical protein